MFEWISDWLSIFSVGEKVRPAAVLWIPNNYYIDGQKCTHLLEDKVDHLSMRERLKLPVREFVACERITPSAAPGIKQEDGNGVQWYPRGRAIAAWCEVEEGNATLPDASWELFQKEIEKAREISRRAAADTLELHEKLDRPVIEKAKIVMGQNRRLTFATQGVIMGEGLVTWSGELKPPPMEATNH